MQNSHLLLPNHINALIHRPVCPRCRAHMLLTRIEPARLGFDYRAFECAFCDHMCDAMVANDAIQHESVWHDHATKVIAEAGEMPLGEARRTAVKETSVRADLALRARSAECGDRDWRHRRSHKPIAKGGH